ncbi:hypothetical protein MHU86_12751 [Fragilaria crotonensis]|nr:hypothetical protein MHU86_12751 [Fragilaria crotonensis]
MPSLVKLPLPAGKLGVVFKGSPPVVVRILDDSPMKGRVKDGYIFQSLILNDGTFVENLTTSQLVETLNETSEETDRRLVMEIALPDDADVALPEGRIGASVQTINGKPTITHVDANSPLKHSLRVGYVVDKVVLEDGTELSGHSAAEIEVILAEDCESSGRRLSLVNPSKHTPAPKKVTLPLEKTVALPTGKLGISFKGSIAKVTGIAESSPLKGIVREGFVVDSLKLPGGTEYIGCNASQLVKALTATADVEGRSLLLKGPQSSSLPAAALIKVVLPIFGNAEELGLKFGPGPTIAEIKESSTLLGKLSVGQTVTMVHDGQDVAYNVTSEEKVVDALLDSSGSRGRYLVVNG